MYPELNAIAAVATLSSMLWAGEPGRGGLLLFSFETQKEMAGVRVGRSEGATVAKHATLNERPNRASRPGRDKHTVARTRCRKGGRPVVSS